MLRLPNCTDKHQMLIILTNPTSDIWILRLTKQTCWPDFGKTGLLCGHFDVITSRLWRHQQNIKRASETWDDVRRSSFLASFMDSLCCVRNKMMYVLLWQWTVYALTRVLFWCLFPLLLRNSGNQHKNNPLVSAETVRHSSTYIILYI